METSESVTQWLEHLKGGDSEAAQHLWNRYIAQLVRLARHKLGPSERRVADEEDVASMAFAHFFEGVEAGRFPKLDDRDDLWRVLIMLTERKAIDQRRHQLAEKRGGGKLRGESVFADKSDLDQPGIAAIIDSQPTPEFAVQVAEELKNRLKSLNDPELQRIASAKGDGLSNADIADKLDCSVRTVERRLELIRKIWESAP